jgi:hypothetical protein
VGVVDLVVGEAPQPSVLTLQHQLQQEQSSQAMPLSKVIREENETPRNRARKCRNCSR